MRIVTDILFVGEAPVAFMQEKGDNGELTYKAVCPWCACNLKDGITAPTYGELAEILFDYTAVHVKKHCVNRLNTELMVQIR